MTRLAVLESFWSTFSLYKFVSPWKKLGYFIDLFRRLGWLKILKSDCLRTFWPISLEKTPQIWDFCRNTVKFFDKFKKSCFWPIFPSFGTKKDPSGYEPIFLSYHGIRIVHRIASTRMKEQIAFKNKVRMKQLTGLCLLNILHYN